MKTSVLFLIFNREDTALKVFERIREAKPKKLFIAADGPRQNKTGETEICKNLREKIVQKVDWDCEINTLFREKNLGCKLAVSGAIDWFFENVETGIILEDDCLPDLSFFPYCEELLEKYQSTENVMMISGDYFLNEPPTKDSYFFSQFPHIWGWATWRRAWKKYDVKMTKWLELKDSKYLEKNFPKDIAKRLSNMFDFASTDAITTWDSQWVFACLKSQGLCVYPNQNLVTNIEPTGTHMKPYDPCIFLPTKPMQFPMTHPTEIKFNQAADSYTQSTILFRSPLKVIQLILKYLFIKKTGDSFFKKIKKTYNPLRKEITFILKNKWK